MSDKKTPNMEVFESFKKKKKKKNHTYLVKKLKEKEKSRLIQKFRRNELKNSSIIYFILRNTNIVKFGEQH